ncbi:MAG TPA: hypothetical protein VI793_11195 [Anaerolineales bacterium]|nr:hypothetical protein [Anaerolineales bacterium]
MSLPTRVASHLVKPTLKTKFHIDFDWWDRESSEFRVYLMSHLCPEHQAAFGSYEGGDLIDNVDPDTAEVQRIDGLHYTLRAHCAQQPDFLTARTTLVDAVFRVFIANGNRPLTPEELAEKINRPGQANTILRTLAGQRVYKGLRPLADEPA